MPPDQVTYEAPLNTLDYLQPERTRPWENELYARGRKLFHYDCERVGIDSTVVELSGKLGRVLAKFGHSKQGGTSKHRQIMVTFLVDQRGSLLGHEVYPGNTNDTKTLASVDRRLREEYDTAVAQAPRVVDRGMRAWRTCGSSVGGRNGSWWRYEPSRKDSTCWRSSDLKCSGPRSAPECERPRWSGRG